MLATVPTVSPRPRPMPRPSTRRGHRTPSADPRARPPALQPATRPTVWLAMRPAVRLAVPLAVLAAAGAGIARPAGAQQGEDRLARARAEFELYGFVMSDAVFDRTGIDGDWLDTARPTRLPPTRGAFGERGAFFLGVRQTRIGIRPRVPTPIGEVTGRLEFDLLGTGPEVGRTAPRLRHAYVSVGRFSFGQLESGWMDVDVFPGVIDYWGPNGLVFFRNVQLQWRPLDDGRRRLAVALERPGATPDAGDYADRVELRNVRLRFPAPDLTAHYRYADPRWGHVQLGGIVRYIRWDDQAGDALDLSGRTVGAGAALSGVVRVAPRVRLRGVGMVGRAVQNYLNDGPEDIGVRAGATLGRPLEGAPLPVGSLVTYADVAWSPRWSSSVGYSTVRVRNSEGQAATAYRRGDYASVNLLWYPTPSMLVGPEVQYVARHGRHGGDGAHRADGLRLQLSAKYAFAARFGVPDRSAP